MSQMIFGCTLIEMDLGGDTARLLTMCMQVLGQHMAPPNPALELQALEHLDQI